MRRFQSIFNPSTGLRGREPSGRIGSGQVFQFFPRSGILLRRTIFNSKGLTLIELVIVIIIVGILSVALLAIINPITRINQANDAKVYADFNRVIQALEAYYMSHSLSYPLALSDLVTANEIKVVPTPPGTSYAVTYTAQTTAGAVCTTAAENCKKASLHATLSAPKSSTLPILCWKSSTGALTEIAAVTSCVP